MKNYLAVVLLFSAMMIAQFIAQKSRWNEPASALSFSLLVFSQSSLEWSVSYLFQGYYFDGIYPPLNPKQCQWGTSISSGIPSESADLGRSCRKSRCRYPRTSEAKQQIVPELVVTHKNGWQEPKRVMY